MELLLTGFEPFGGSWLNPSQQVATSLDGSVSGGLHVRSHILPVDGHRAPRGLLDRIHEWSPDAVLCLGEAPHRPVISIERVAVNLLDYPIPDNRGKQVVDQPIRKQGPAAYFSTLPVRMIYNTLRSKEIPVELSQSAGVYLCNQIMYSLLDHLALNNLTIMAGFIHLPSLPAQVATSGSVFASMSLEIEMQAIRWVIEIISDRLIKMVGKKRRDP
jgi:pyroglutamyl-peptidase